MRDFTAVLLSTALLAIGASEVEPSGIDACLDLEPAAARVECATTVVLEGGLSHGDLAALEREVDRNPEAMVDLSGGVVTVLDDTGDATAAVRAAVLDLLGRALFRLSRHPASADAYHRAIALDPGTVELPWLREGETVWSAEIDPGNGRLVRAGRSFVFAGRQGDARAALERVVALGAGEEARVFWNLLEGGSGAGSDVSGERLLAPEWFERIPDLEIRGLDRAPIEVPSRPGAVVLLDFWASWCAPCRVELPRLQMLVRDEEANGLLAVAVNTDESDDVARAAAASIGVTLPIGRYDETLDEFFLVRQLPAVVLVDREGRIRRRWDGYRDGIEREIAGATRALLREPDNAIETEEIGTAVPGELRLDVRWSRDLGKSIGGVAVARDGSGPPQIFALAGRAIVTVRADGKVLSGFEAPAGSGRLVAGDVTGDGHSDLVGFRPGGDRVAVLDLTTGAAANWTGPAPCFEVTYLPPGEDGTGGLLLSTTEGLFVSDALGRVSSRMQGSIRSARPLAGNGNGAVLALLDGGRLRWVGRDGTLVREQDTGLDGWSLVTAEADHGFGIAPPAVVDSVVGRFVAGAERQVAVATRTGRLVVIEVGSGRILAVAIVPGMVQIQASDLDGDGVDEIVVGAGERLTALGTAPGEFPN